MGKFWTNWDTLTLKMHDIDMTSMSKTPTLINIMNGFTLLDQVTQQYCTYQQMFKTWHNHISAGDEYLHSPHSTSLPFWRIYLNQKSSVIKTCIQNHEGSVMQLLFVVTLWIQTFTVFFYWHLDLIMTCTLVCQYKKAMGP
jgi:hypothetical protein